MILTVLHDDPLCPHGRPAAAVCDDCLAEVMGYGDPREDPPCDRAYPHEPHSYVRFSQQMPLRCPGRKR
jgi:hypothetical protein